MGVAWRNPKTTHQKSTINGRKRCIRSQPLELTSPYLIGSIANPNNNPVFNISNTFTWLKGRHTYTLGGTFRRTTVWRTSGGEPDFYSLGIAAGDPVSGIFNTTTIPGLRPADLGNAQALYAYLTGRISGISGARQIDENSKQYGPIQGTFRTAHNVGGLYVQDSFRWNPSLTVNYGLRWEMTGAMHNTNDVYTSPTLEHLKGPSTEPFRPGVLDGVLDPQIFQQSKPYKADPWNFAPNVGAAWSLEPKNGFFGKLLGRSVVRGNFGVNYYDEGTVTFETAAGSNPGRTQSVFLNPGDPGFTPGGLSLGAAVPQLPALPAEFRFPMSQGLFTFSGGLRTIDPNIKTPYIYNWSVGIQRELWTDAAVEVRYLANAGRNLWRSYNLNEVNIFENSFLDQFEAAQRNLAINVANGRTGFADNGLPGQAAADLRCCIRRARWPRRAPDRQRIHERHVCHAAPTRPGRPTREHAGRQRDLSVPHGRQQFGAVLDVGLFGARCLSNQLLPDESVRGRPSRPGSHGRSHIALRLAPGAVPPAHPRRVDVTANYTYGHARTDSYIDSPSAEADYITLRDKSLNWGPDVYDVRSSFAGYWTYELPFGRNRHFTIDNAVLDHFLGGWAFSGVLHAQTGRPFLLTSDRWTVNQNSAGVVLNNITVKELQKMVKVSPGPNGNVYFLDPRLIGPDGRANPEYLSVPSTPGELGEHVYLYGPRLFDVDFRLGKRINLGQTVNFNFEALFLSVFNNASYLVGDTGGARLNIESTTFGQTSTMGAGPRAIVLRVQVNY